MVLAGVDPDRAGPPRTGTHLPAQEVIAMDGSRFDDLLRSAVHQPSRRALLRSLGSGAAVGALVRIGLRPAAADVSGEACQGIRQTCDSRSECCGGGRLRCRRITRKCKRNRLRRENRCCSTGDTPCRNNCDCCRGFACNNDTSQCVKT
jgi:hypothetical protein